MFPGIVLYPEVHRDLIDFKCFFTGKCFNYSADGFLMFIIFAEGSFLLPSRATELLVLR